jgi:predicted transcriptional regulator YheO
MSNNIYIENAKNTANAVAQLFYPNVEAVVHDFGTCEIAGIYNSFSKRKVGDKSYFDELQVQVKDLIDIFPPYKKVNFDGKKIKSTSISIKDEQGNNIGVLCINVDISVYEDLASKLNGMIDVSNQSLNPIEAASKNWQSKLVGEINDYKQKNLVSKEKLGSKDKRNIVNLLYKKGFLNYKNAVNFIGEQLNLSRASIYNYLKH